MNESIFSRLFHYKATEKMKPMENYLTEMLSWLVDNISAFAYDYLSFLTEKSNSERKLKVQNIGAIHSETQVTCKNGYIDMVITTDEHIGFLCEHKVESELSDDQIKKYLECTEEIASEMEFQTVLLTKRKEQHTQSADVQIVWKDIYDYFETRLESYDDRDKMMIEQFLIYLTEVGMGKQEAIGFGSVEHYCEAMQLEQKLKMMLSSLADEVNWEKECPGIADFVSDYSVQFVRKRWGRIGIEFSRSWNPSIFAGVILDNTDHKLRDFHDTPQLVVLIDCDMTLPDRTLADKKVETILQTIGSENGGFSIETKPENKWRRLILEKPLMEVLKDETYEKQVESIKAEIIKGIHLILEHYFIDTSGQFVDSKSII